MTSVGEELNCGHPQWCMEILLLHVLFFVSFFSRNCASELRDAAVGSREEQHWVGEEGNSQSSSSVMACLLTGIMDALEAKARTGAGGKESDSLWPENPPCFHLNNHFKLWLPPLATVALIPPSTSQA